MALPSSGQISLNDFRTETAQSSMINYSMYEASIGHNPLWGGSQNYAPICLPFKTESFTEANQLDYTNLELSTWYGYQHDYYHNTNTTASLFHHAKPQCYRSSMVIFDLGTTSRTVNLNFSGSVDGDSVFYIYYGKPWKIDGAPGTSASSTLVTSSLGITSMNDTYVYNYTYDSNVGQYLYFIILDWSCFT